MSSTSLQSFPMACRGRCPGSAGAALVQLARWEGAVQVVRQQAMMASAWCSSSGFLQRVQGTVVLLYWRYQTIYDSAMRYCCERVVSGA